MKTIIYLPLIALIVLCSCKSNSFMKQRYTNFAHASTKNTISKKKIAKAETPVIQKEEVAIEEYPQTASVAETGPIVFVKENVFKPIKSNIQRSNLSFNKQVTKEVENSKTELKNKNVIQKQKSAAQRIIGTLLKIVLWVIILAVVVGVIIIIGALA